MIRFFEADIDETDEAAAVVEVCKAAIREVRRYKDPYKTLNDMYKAFEEEFYKVPYSILYKVEACLITGADISDEYTPGCGEVGEAFDVGDGTFIDWRDYKALAGFWNVSISTCHFT